MTLLLWAVFTAMTAVAAAGVAIPLVRRYDRQAGERDAVTAVLRDQLGEIDAQAASGQIAASEAEALRTEVKRRLLAENRAVPLPARILGDRGASRLALGAATVVALGATAIYAVHGRPDLTSPAPPGVIAAEVAQLDTGAASVANPSNPSAAGIAPLIVQLEARMAKAPGDPEGWRMLGWSYFQTQRFADSAAAYAKAVALDPRGEGYASALGEALVQAANGVVTPAAAKAFADARALNPADPRARYFLAVRRDQAGDRKGALDEWVALLDTAPSDAPWAPGLRRFVERSAREAGVDLTGRLAAPLPIVAGTANARGPAAGDAASVEAMAPAARQAFIRNMVDTLAAKLKANPRDADGWIRLIRARKVLGDLPAARTALRDGQAAFADQPAMRAAIGAEAGKFGVS